MSIPCLSFGAFVSCQPFSTASKIQDVDQEIGCSLLHNLTVEKNKVPTMENG